MRTFSILALLGAARLAFGQQSAWGQCGGINWTGLTTCDSGYVCTYQNDWYSQCLQGTAVTTSSTRTTSSSSVRTTSTTSSRSTTSTVPTSTSSTRSTSSSTSRTSSASGSTATRYMFAFGDSYTSTGFSISNTLPSASNPMGNPTPPSRWWTDSYNWAEYLTINYKTGTLLTYDFAVGGVCVDVSIVLNCGSRTHFDDQIEGIFLSSLVPATSATAWTSTNALFASWIGINDIWDTETWTSPTYQTTNQALMDRYFALQEELYNAGARNFLFINIPKIQSSPRTVALSSTLQSTEATIVADYNTRLNTKIAAFKSAHSAAKVFFYDSMASSTKIIATPSLAGYTTASGSGSTSVWYDDYHFRTGVHKIFAQEIAALLTSGGFW